MGFIKAFTGALSGTFKDQWKDFYRPASNVSATSALYQAEPNGTNNGIGENTKSSNNIITNGSKIIVPEGTALITLQDGEITGLISEAGGYEFRSDDVNSKSMFAGDGILSSTIKESWERFKFGGQPGSEQLAFYVNLKEIPNNKFGTQTAIYWDDKFLGTQVGAITRGTYSLKIVDPLLFVKNFVPTKYLEPDAKPFDFADMENDSANQLFTEVVGTLNQAFSRYTNDANKENRISNIQADSVGFAKSMSQTIEESYQWKSNRGLEIVSATILAIEYDEASKELIEQAKKDDVELRRKTKMGAAYSNDMSGMMASSTAEAINAASRNENGSMMGFMGMNMAQNVGANVIGAATQSQNNAGENPSNNIKSEQSSADKLLEMKKLLDAGAITQEEYDKIKAQLLGI